MVKKDQKLKKLLDLKKIDIAILKDSEKNRIYGGMETYDGPTCYWSCVMGCTMPGQCEGTGTCADTCNTCPANTCETCINCPTNPPSAVGDTCGPYCA